MRRGRRPVDPTADRISPDARLRTGEGTLCAGPSCPPAHTDSTMTSRLDLPDQAPHERRASVPSGWLGAWYCSWPLLAAAWMIFDGSGWRDGFFWVFFLGALAYGTYHTAHRRRNRVDVIGTHVRLTSRGKVTDFEASDIRALNWAYGNWTSFSPTVDWTTLGVTLSDGREFHVELVLPRWRDQRRALRRLADALPTIDWTIRWPYSVFKRDRVWNSTEGRAPR